MQVKRIRGMTPNADWSCPYPLQALAFIVGDRDLEQELHARLADYREHREWFRDDPEVRTVLICTGRKHGGVWAL